MKRLHKRDRKRAHKESTFFGSTSCLLKKEPTFSFRRKLALLPAPRFSNVFGMCFFKFLFSTCLFRPGDDHDVVSLSAGTLVVVQGVTTPLLAPMREKRRVGPRLLIYRKKRESSSGVSLPKFPNVGGGDFLDRLF